MTKKTSTEHKDQTTPEQAQNQVAESTNVVTTAKTTQPHSSKEPKKNKVAAGETKGPKRRIRFADPVAHRRIYERPISPHDAEHIREISSKTKGRNVNELEPPYSLIANLDLAAKKLNARPSAMSGLAATQQSSKQSHSPAETESSIKSTKSTINQPLMSYKSAAAQATKSASQQATSPQAQPSPSPTGSSKTQTPTTAAKTTEPSSSKTARG